MNKRKANGLDKPKPSADEDSGSDDDSTSLLNVDFEYFDPNPTIDFQGLKTLLRQLFDADNQLFDLSALADLILAQPLLGSTIKCEGQDTDPLETDLQETDPYAFLTVLNMHAHREKAVVQQLQKYVLERSTAEVRARLAALLDPTEEAKQVGLILTERVVNMPSQTIPPMYTMLLEEIQWANEENEPYQFTHYLVISKTFTEIESQLDAEDDRPQKKSKKSGSAGMEVSYFHPEDEVLQKHAVASCGFEYAKAEDGTSDSKRAFQELGVRPQGLLILLEGNKLEDAVKGMSEFVGADAEGRLAAMG